VSQIRGRANDGRLVTDLQATGEQVSFGSELVEQGLQNSAPLSQAVWLGPRSS